MTLLQVQPWSASYLRLLGRRLRLSGRELMR
jgi:hypothetical protein